MTKQYITAGLLCFAALCGQVLLAEPQPPVTITAHAYDENGLGYMLKNNTYCLTAIDSKLTEITVPDTVNGYPVTRVLSNLFAGNTKITSVSLPDTITSLDAGTFKDCTALEYLKLPNALDSIPESLCENDNVLVTVEMPEYCHSIEKNAFLCCYKMENAVLPSNCRTIDEYAFGFCRVWNCMQLPETLTHISSHAFHFCFKMGDIVLTDNMEIENEAFYIASIEKLTITKDIFERGIQSLFAPKESKGVNVRHLILPDNITCIHEGALTNMTALESITIPNGVTTIEYGAFQNDKRLEEIIIPNSVTEVDPYAFIYCGTRSSPINLTISQYITDNYDTLINKHLIHDKINITFADGVTTIPEIIFNGNYHLTSVHIPASVTTINNNAFCGCKNLTDVTIENGDMQFIGKDAFANCPYLQSIWIYNPKCQIYDSIDTLSTPKYTTTATHLSGRTLLYGEENSTVQAYAEKYGYDFSVVTTPAAKQEPSGDINSDDKINASDAADILIAAARLGSGQDAGLTDEQNYNADLNKDDKINALDAALILQYAAYHGSGGAMDLTDWLNTQKS